MSDIQLHKVKARVFFEILKSGDTSLLEVKNHDKEFDELYDKYFEAQDNQKDKQNLSNLLDIAKYRLILSKIDLIIEVLKFPKDNRHKEKINAILKELGLKCGINDDGLLDELKQKAGIIWNELQILSAETKTTKKTKVNYTFSDIIISFENTLNRSISSEIDLEKFISYQKACKRITDKRKHNE